MTSAVKPRYGSAARRESGSAIMSSSSDDKTEKDAKIRRTESLQVKYILGMIGLLTMAALYLGRKAPSHHQLGSIRSEGGNLPFDVEQLGMTSEQLIEDKLVRKVKSLDEKVRAHKAKKDIIMETDPTGLELTKELQHWTFKLLVQRYGHYTFRVVLDLEFPPTIPDYEEKGASGKVTLQMAPISLIPCSVFNFMEIARTWKSGAFHRNANHVLQASAQSEVRKAMPFQEYSPEHPHAKGTSGYAGRPSGPGFYISIQDNTVNHGPGSQQKHNPHEADANFGEVVQGFDDVVPRIHSIPQNGWLDKDHKIKIMTMTILYKAEKEDGKGEWVPWKKETPSEVAQSK
jgi:hypothetical protein